MKIEQVYSLVNTTVSEILGRDEVVLEDLSNIVDVGNEVLGVDGVDNYVRKLVNHIGKVIFNDRVYKGNVPSVLMDSWEFGSILQKITAEMPQATENESWNLTDGESYNQDIFYQPKVTAKFYNSKVTFEIPVSFTEKQVKESFSNKGQLNAFISMIFNSVENAMTLKIDSLVMRAINNMTAETMLDELGDTEGIKTVDTGVKALNLLKLFNDKYGETLTVDNCYTNAEFIKFSSYIVNLYKDRLSKVSTLFNVGGKERFTSADNLSIVLLSDFASAVNVFLTSDTFNKEMVALPAYETVPYWQGSGKSYTFDDVSKIHVKTSSNKEVEVTGIVGVLFDRAAVGVANLDKRVTTNYNAKAEFYTNFYKLDAGYYNDLNENFIVLFVG